MIAHNHPGLEKAGKELKGLIKGKKRAHIEVPEVLERIQVLKSYCREQEERWIEVSVELQSGE